jgi:hypothetical protein
VQLNFLFLPRCVLGLRGLGFREALLEFIHATGGVHELLLSGVKWMARVADADDDGLLGGARLDHVAAGATDFRVHICRMNVRLHKKSNKPIRKSPDDKREFLMERRKCAASSVVTRPEMLARTWAEVMKFVVCRLSRFRVSTLFLGRNFVRGNIALR